LGAVVGSKGLWYYLTKVFMRKALFVTISFIVVSSVILLFVYFSRQGARPPEGPPAVVENPTPTPIPQSDTIFISNTEVSNFYKTAKKIGESGEIYLSNNNPERYQILYMESFDQFLISILAGPFQTVREEAEQDLLRQLNIPQDEACALDVSITTPTFVNPDSSGKTYGLSFCE
jgi:hypothetical protein